MFQWIIISCLIALVAALVLKCRALAQDVETLYDMVRVVQGLPPRDPNAAPQPDAIDHARNAVAQHEAQFHKR